MGNFKNKLLSVMAVLFGAFVMFVGCGKVSYEKMSVATTVTTVNGTFNDDVEIVLDDEDQSNNIFTVSAQVSNAPKGYNGEVEIGFEIDNGAIVKAGEKTFSNGKTVQQYKAVQAGLQVISVKTLQGNKSDSIKITVVEPVKSVNFKTKNLLVKAGNKINFYDMLVFNNNPNYSSSTQKKVTYTISDIQDNIDETIIAEMLQELNTTGSITFTKDMNLPEFKITATSAVNPEISDSITVNVVDFVESSQVILKANDEVLENNNGEFSIELAKNINGLNIANLEFDFNVGEDKDLYIVKASNFENSTLALNNLSHINKFQLSAIGETSEPYKITFTIFHNDNVDDDYLRTEVTLNVTVVSYPKNIIVENENGEQVTNVTIYKNMAPGSDAKGVPVYVYAMDNVGSNANKMINQEILVTLPINSKVEVRNSSGKLLEGEVVIKTGDVLYVKHNYDGTALDSEINNLYLKFKSVKYANASFNLKLNVIKGDINLSTAQPNIDINLAPVDINIDGEDVHFENGFQFLQIQGLPQGFDYKDLKVQILDTNLVEAYVTTNSIGLKGLGNIGTTKVIVSAGNGSSVTFNIKTFEELLADIDNTYITLPNGQKIGVYEASTEDGSLEVVGNIVDLNLQGGIGVKLNFVINGKTYTSIPSGYSPISNSTDASIATILNNNQISTSTRFGNAQLTLTIKGYNKNGEFNKIIKFVINVEVEVKVNALKNNLGTSSAINKYSIDTVVESDWDKYAKQTVGIYLDPAGLFFNENLQFDVNILSNYNFNKPVIDTSNAGITTYVFNEVKGLASVFVEVPNENTTTKNVVIYASLNSSISSTFAVTLEFSISQTFNDFSSIVTEVKNVVKTTVNANFSRANLLTNITAQVTNKTIYFDTRDFVDSPADGIYAEKQIKVNVFPTNALNKKVEALSESEFVQLETTFDGSYSYVNIKLVKNKEGALPNTENGKPIKIKIGAVDSKTSGGVYTIYDEVFVYINDGTASNPFQVKTEADLYKINNGMDKYYVILNDIYLNGNYTPIGLNSDGSVTPFTGNITGLSSITVNGAATGETNQSTIHNLNMNYASEQTYYGLFASLGRDAVVSNIVLNNIKLQYRPAVLKDFTNVYIGAIAGYSEGATIQNCSVIGKNDISTFEYSKLAGSDYDFDINLHDTKISADGSATLTNANLYVGGIVGFANTINNVTTKLYNNNVNLKIRVSENSAEKSLTNVGGVVGYLNGGRIVYNEENSIVETSDVYVVIVVNGDTSKIYSEDDYANANAVGGVAGVINSATISGATVSSYINAENFNLVAGAVGYVYNSNLFNTTAMPIISGSDIVAGLIGKMLFDNKGSDQYNAIDNNKVEFIYNQYEDSMFNSALKSANVSAGLIGIASNLRIVNNNFVDNKELNVIVSNNAVSGYTSKDAVNYYGDIVSLSNEKTIKNYVAGLVYEVNNIVLVNNQVIANLAFVENGVSTTELEVAGLVNKFSGISSIIKTSAIVNLTAFGDYSKVTSRNISAFISDAGNYNANMEVQPNNLSADSTFGVGSDNGNVNKSNDEYTFGEISYKFLNFEDDNITYKDETKYAFAVQNSFVNFEIKNSDIGLNSEIERRFVGNGYEKTLQQDYMNEGVLDTANYNIINVVFVNSALNLAEGKDANGYVLKTVGGSNSTAGSAEGEIVSAVASTNELENTSFTNLTSNIYTLNEELNNADSVDSVAVDVKTNYLNTIYEGSSGSSLGYEEGEEESVNTANWYVNSGINNGVITNFGKTNLKDVNGQQVVNLLTNFAPSDINITQNENKENIWLVNDNSNLQTVLYYYDLSSDSYLPNSDINLNDYNLSSEQKLKASNLIKQQLQLKNTYLLSDVFANLSCVPAFLNINKLKITSSNNAVMQVVTTANNQLAIKVLKTGSAELIVSSIYDRNVSKNVTINVVSAVDKFEMFLNPSKTQVADGENVNVIKGRTQNLYASNGSSIDFNVVLADNFGIDVEYTFSFNLNNTNKSGVRFFYAEDEKIYKDVEGSSLNTDTVSISINKQKFVKDADSGYYYIDIASGEDISVTGELFGSTQVIAVPYLEVGNTKLLVVDIEKLVNEKAQTNTNASVISFNVINGTSNLKANRSEITLSSQNSDIFNVTITTEEEREILFLSYVTSYGEIILPVNNVDFVEQDLNRFNFVSASNSTVSVTELNKLNKFKNGSVLAFNNIELRLLSVNYVDGLKTYTFSINQTTNETEISKIKENLTTNITFFTANVDSKIVVDNENSLNVNIDSVKNYSQSINVTVQPQEVISHTLLHYPNGEYVVDENGNVTTNRDWDEVAYNNIIPSYNGILKLNVYPWFANLDYVEIVARGNNDEKMSLEQLVAVYSNEYVSNYQPIYPQNEIIQDGYGIRLYKASYVNFNNGVVESYGFDGNIYIRTLISSTTVSSTSFYITVTGYAENGTSSTIVFSNTVAPLQLDVIVPPSIDLSINGEKEAPIAIGMSAEIDIKKYNLDGEVTFEKSTISGNSFTDFTVTNNGSTLVVNCPSGSSVKPGVIIKIVGSGKKVINNRTYEATDTVTLIVTEFVVKGITLENVNDGKLTGLFNQKHLLSIKVQAEYDTSSAINAKFVEEKINALNNYLTYSVNGENLMSRYYLRTYGVGKVIDTNITQNISNNFEITAETVSNNTKALFLQNKVFNSADRLVVKVKIQYSTESCDGDTNNYFGGVTVVNNLSSASDFTYEYECEFGFGFYRLSNEDNPDPIYNVESLMGMQSGGDYILQSDLELTNWQPLNVDINSLDGNGYIITIKSFDINAQSGQNSANIGLFEEIHASTTLKNLNIRIMPNGGSKLNEKIPSSNSMSGDIFADLTIDATAFNNVNFGILAGFNYGTITNCNVDYVAEDIVEIRERALKNGNNNTVDEEYINNWKNVESNYNTLRDLSIIRVKAKETSQQLTHNIAGLVGTNSGYITNSSVENISIYGMGNLAGLVATNNGKISSSYYKGANIVNLTPNTSSYSATAGLVVNNTLSGEIQYSYAEGREGSYIGLNEDALKTTDIEKGYFIVSTAEDDKTNLDKKLYSSYNLKIALFNELAKETPEIDDNTINLVKESLNLRAMNSAIVSSGNVASFVYTNSGKVSNAYANFMVYTSGASASGFVFENNGTISDTYTLSSIQVENENYMPFTGASKSSSSIVIPNNKGSISYSQYLKLGTSVNELEFIRKYADSFHDDNEPASSIGTIEFSEYNTFQGFAFNNDFDSNENITNAVWYIRTYERDETLKDNNNEYVLFNNNYFKTSTNILNRPQLVSANLRTLSFRKIVSGSTSAKNEYVYMSYVADNSPTFAYGTSGNPYLVDSARNFNIFVQESSIVDNVNKPATDDSMDYRIFNNSIRFIKDISFNNTDVKANTYNIEYAGDLDGNGMQISNVRIIADSDFESQNGQLDYLGLFGKIVSVANVNGRISVLDENGLVNGQTVKESEILNRGNVRNLKVEVDQVDGSNVHIVGALAGIITNADVSNITITPMNSSVIIKGKNAVGGLAGLVNGNSEITNINTNINVTASYFSNANPFNSNSAANSISKGFNIYSKTILVDETKDYVNNLTTLNVNGKEVGVSYAGAVVGVLDVNAENRVYSNISSKSLRNSMARKFVVNGSVTITGEIVGGVIGLVGEKASVSDMIFEVNRDETPKLNASRIAGGIVGENRGEIQRSYTTHEETWQKQIDSSIQTQVNRNATNISVDDEYKTLFTGNPNYMGALVGFNNDGTIRNSYARVSAENPNAMYAGGIVGINQGGIINSVYTTASVESYFVMGGAIGLQLPQIIVQNNDNSAIYTEGLCFAEDTNIFDFNYESKNVYINKEFLTNADNASSISNTVVAAMWKESVTKNTRKQNIGKNSVIGGFIGTLIAPRDQDSGLYNINSSIRTDVSVNRAITETNFFVQPKDGGLVNTNGVVRKYNEIGTINNESSNNYANSQSEIMDNKIVGSNNSVVSISDSGEVGYRSGYLKTTSAVDNKETYYRYSRMFNVGSARTYKEILSRKFIETEAKPNGDNNKTELTSEQKLNENTKRLHIYSSFSKVYWNGILLENETIPQTDNSVFPYLSYKPEVGKILVYTEDDLRLMQDNLYAEFVLMNDITINETWQAVGTEIEPFSGEIYSDGDNVYTITFKANIESNTQDAYGIVGYAEGANFRNFNVANAQISIAKEDAESGYAYHVGVVAGIVNNTSPSDATTFENITIINPNIAVYEIKSVGGIVGTGYYTYIKNCKVITTTESENSKIQVLGVYDSSANVNVGGIAGVLEGVGSNAGNNLILGNNDSAGDNFDYDVENLKIIINASSTNNTLENINVGGVVGSLNCGINTIDSAILENNGYKVLGTSTKNVLIQVNETAKTKNVNVGGIVGDANGVVINDYSWEEKVDGETQTLVKSTETLDSYIKVGNSANAKTSLKVGLVSGNIKNALLNNIDVIRNSNFTEGSENIVVNNANVTNAYIGGVFGYADILNATNINVENIYINSTNNNTGFIGGVAGTLLTSENGSNIAVKNLNLTLTSANNATRVGGVAGEMGGSFAKLATSGKITSNVTNIGINVGGVAGNNTAEITESLSNVNILQNGTSAQTQHIAGFVGENSGTIENSYSTGCVNVEKATLTGSGTYIAGFVANNKDEGSISNSYTISKLFANNSNAEISYNNFHNTTNKGGFVAKGDVNATCYYSLDLVSYSANKGTAKTTQDLLFSKEKPSELTSGVWKGKTADEYPMFASTFFNDFQLEGTNQKPSENVYNAEFNSYILTDTNKDSFVGKDLANVTIYAKDSTTFGGVNSLDETSVLFGVQSYNTNASMVGTNNGLIIGTRLNSYNGNLVATNNGIIFDTKLNIKTDSTTGAISKVNNIILNGNVITTNKGVVEKLTAFADNGATRYIAGGNGLLVEVAAHTGKTEATAFGIYNGNTIKNSYSIGSNYSYYYDFDGNQYSSSSANFKPMNDITLFLYNNNAATNFDFVDTFVMFGHSNSINSGAPVLRYELKENWYDKDIKDVYYWIKTKVTSDVTAEGVVNIDSVEDLVYVAQNISEFSSANLQITEDLDFAKLGGNYVNKLWTPIGYSAFNYDNNKYSFTTISGSLIGAKSVDTGLTYSTISNLMVMESGRNAGLISNTNGKFEISNLKIANSTFACVGNSDVINDTSGQHTNYNSTVTAAPFVAHSKNENTSKTLTANKLASENNIVVSSGFASGIIGDIHNGTISNSYSAFGKVGTTTSGQSTYANAIAYKSGSGTLTVNNSYFASNLIKGTNFVSRSNGNAETTNSYYLENCGVTNGATSKTNFEFLTQKFDGFNWGTVWGRNAGVNNGYPAHTGVVTAWIGDKEEVKPSGTTYTINTPQQLAWVTNQVKNGNTFVGYTIQLGADIDLSEKLWTPIGFYVSDTNKKAFAGTFNFNGHTITNMRVYAYYTTGNCSSDGIISNASLGLFGYTNGAIINGNTNGASIRNAAVFGGNYLAVIAGYSENTTINNVVFDNKTVAGDATTNYIYVNGNNYIGGIVGYIKENVTIKNTTLNTNSVAVVTNSEIKGVEQVGGIFGYSYGSDNTNKKLLIENVYNNLNVTGGRNVGGIAGSTDTNTNMFNVRNVASINGSISTGGIVGYTTRRNTSRSAGAKFILDNTELLNSSNNIISTNSGNVSLINSNLSDTHYAVAGVVGHINTASDYVFIEGVQNSGNIINDSSKPSGVEVGGIVGLNQGGYISEVINSGTITTGTSTAGSFVGKIDSGTLVNASDNVNTTLNATGSHGSETGISDSGTINSSVIVYANNKDSNGSLRSEGSLWSADGTTVEYNKTWFKRSERIKSIPDDNFYSVQKVNNGIIKSDVSINVDTADKLNFVANYVASSPLNIYNNTNVNLTQTSGSVANSSLERAIGSYYYPYKGTFEGNNKSISVSKSLETSGNGNSANFATGIFGRVLNANVQNLQVALNSNLSINSASYHALVVGNVDNSTLNNVSTTGSATLTLGSQSGGIASIVSENSTIENSSNNVTITSSGSLGGIAYTNEGIIRNSQNTKSVTSTASAGTYRVGGIVATSGGELINVSNTGTITGYRYVGGIVGYLSKGVVKGNNASEMVVNSGEIIGNYNTGGIVGQILSNSRVEYSKNSGSVHGLNNNSGQNLGGIVGDFLSGEVLNCTNSGTIAGIKYFGGIVGEAGSSGSSSVASIKNCTNSGTIDSHGSDGPSNEDTDIGGIVGRTFSTVEGCTNNGLVYAIKSTGGIAGSAQESSIKNCTNNGEIRRETSVGDSATYVGGIVGYSTSTISGSSNTKAVGGATQVGGIAGYSTKTITSSKNSGAISGDTKVGGIVGYTTGAITGTSSNKTINSGAITGAGDYVGGIVGQSDNNIGFVSNSGSVCGDNYVAGIVGSINGNKIEYATNDAKITNNKPSSVEVFNYTAGIVGFAKSTTMYYVINNGEIEGDSNVAGIICVGESVNIEFAKNTGEIISKGNSLDTGMFNDMIMIASIAAALGDSTINIAYNTADISISSGFGISGGIAGGISSTTIKNTYTQDIRIEGTSYAGGIVGIAQNASKIYFSYSRSTYIGSYEAVAAGGIVGVSVGSTITSNFFIAMIDEVLKTSDGSSRGFAVGVSIDSDIQSFAYVGINVTLNAVGKNEDSTIGYVYKGNSSSYRMFSRDNKDFFTEGKITTEDGGSCTYGGSTVSTSEFAWYTPESTSETSWDLNSIWTTTDIELFNFIAFKF